MRAVPALLIACPALMTIAFAARAEDPVDATQQVIEQQIKAFLADDVEAAYALAAPGIKERYPDKNLFFSMVKKTYEPVYHPGNYAFGRSKTLENGAVVVQELMITGEDGKNWKAFYKMTRQADGTYKIGGVIMVPDVVSKGI